MDANAFITKLRADGSENDLHDLAKVYVEFSTISATLSAKDRELFSLNVLCILCRNLDKVPSWRAKINQTELLNLSIQCLRETRNLAGENRVKILASTYHIHKYAVTEISDAPPQIVLKLSYMPFENDLLPNYAKTYGNIIADRLSYIEKLKPKISIRNLLQKLTEDFYKVIQIYDSVQFCSTIINFLIKKLHFLYSSSNPRELSTVYGKIFEVISTKTDLSNFKKLSQKELLDLYVKLTDCLYIIGENSMKINFKESPLTNTVLIIIGLIGHSPDIQHCLQNFLYPICSIFEKDNKMYTETVLNNLITTFETTEKSGYTLTMLSTCPFISQFVKLYIESCLNNENFNWTLKFNENTQESLFKIILFLMKTLKNCDQVSKCLNCNVKTGLHDALRLSLLTKQIISSSIEKNINISSNLPIFYEIMVLQYLTVKELGRKQCYNYEKGFEKVQSDLHNTAILLNSKKYTDYSIKFFNLYILHEIINFDSDISRKNICRALYNKSICQLECKQYKKALVDAYLSLVFAKKELTEKYMSLVIDIKAKSLSNKNDIDSDDLQMLTVVDACQLTVGIEEYVHMQTFFRQLNFGELLKHEFDMYVKLWPSLLPIAGIWRALHQMAKGITLPWIDASDKSTREYLYEVLIETPNVVRSIHNDHFVDIVKDLTAEMEQETEKSQKDKIIYATLCFLKAEFDITNAALVHDWKVKEPTMDPDQADATRTLEQEYEAIKYALQAIDIWTDVIQDLQNVPKTRLVENALKTAEVFVYQFLYLMKTLHGLQLAHICCQIAKYLDDRQSYIRNAGVILSNTVIESAEIHELEKQATIYLKEIIHEKECMEIALCFICDLAIYHTRQGNLDFAAKLVQNVEAHCHYIVEKHPDVNLDMATGRLLDVQIMLFKDKSELSAIVNVQRHYLTVNNTATKWSSRHLKSLTLKHLLTTSGLVASDISRMASLYRRSRSCCGASLRTAGGVGQAKLFAAATDVHRVDDAKKKIDHRLKYILGIPPTSHQPCVTKDPKTEPIFTPKQDLELMLENPIKRPISPTKFPILGFRKPEFLTHKNTCSCFQCEDPNCYILACLTMGLEASMYFRSGEVDVAKNYYEGCQKSLRIAEDRLKKFNKFNKKFEKYLIDNVLKMIDRDFKIVSLEILIENAFFELSLKNFLNADENIVQIHEIMKELGPVDKFLQNEVQNLLIASKKLKDVGQKPKEITLEDEFEKLHLTPNDELTVPPKTPEIKAEKPPSMVKILVKDEEIPKTRRRIIQFRIDEDAEEKPNTSVKPKKSQFKIPPPKTNLALEALTPRNTRPRSVTGAKPKSDTKTTKSDTKTAKSDAKTKLPETRTNLEQSSIFDIATPKVKDKEIDIPNTDFKIPASSNDTLRSSRSQPNILITPATDFSTPNLNESKHKSEFFTPMTIQTPEEFFTPNTSIKTYTKKSLRSNIVKNLEAEFSTPNLNKKEAKNDIDTKNPLDTKNLEAKVLESKSLNDTKIKPSGTKRLPKTSDTEFTSSIPVKTKTEKLRNVKSLDSSENSETKVIKTKISSENVNTENVPKNLEVPKTRTRSKVETGYLKKSLKRATSPGKLDK